MVDKPRILVISFSNIAKDARVLRQLSVVKEFGEVTTLGYGPHPVNTMTHLQVPDGLASLPQTISGVAKLAFRRLAAAELAAPGAQWGLEALAGQKFDVVIANDARALPLAFACKGKAKIWVDLHEWAPEERTQILVWRLLVKPLMVHICRKYLPQVDAATTVGGKIAELYAQNFGIRPRLMRNAPRYVELAPSAVDKNTLRLVHSGGAVAGRNIEATIDAVKELGDKASIDFYLIPANDGGKYLGELRARADGAENICFHEPVAPADLPRTLNQYDVGVFWIPPFNTNARFTLPNKIFDFIQARLALAIGPTVEMVDILKHYDCGVVAADFTKEAIVESLRSLTPEKIAHFKENSARAAQELNFEKEAEAARDILREFLTDEGAKSS